MPFEKQRLQVNDSIFKAIKFCSDAIDNHRGPAMGCQGANDRHLMIVDGEIQNHAEVFRENCLRDPADAGPLIVPQKGEMQELNTETFSHAIGLAALFAVSTLAFTVVKFLGAIYLIFIGTQMILEARRTGAQAQAGDVPRIALRRIFRDGFLVALFNPKTALFFAAFLPQFLDPHGNHLVQSVALGTMFVLIAAITDTLYVLAASAVRGSLGKLSSASRIGKYAGGTAFIGLGVLTAFTGQKAK